MYNPFHSKIHNRALKNAIISLLAGEVMPRVLMCVIRYVVKYDSLILLILCLDFASIVMIIKLKNF